MTTLGRNRPKGRQHLNAEAAGNGWIEGHEATLISRFLIDENAVHQYPNLQSKYFASPVHQKIFEAILRLHYDGHPANFMAVEDYFRRRGKLKEIGENTLTNLVADNRVTAMDDICFNYALDCVMDSYRHREATKICKEFIAGKIGFERTQEQLAKLNEHREPEKSWQDALNAAVVTSSDLNKLELNPRKKLLGDWFCEGDLGFIFAFRGVGKTWFGLGIATALSTGGKLGDWQAHEPVKVLYVDGEMPADLMRNRCEGLGASNANLEFLNHEILFDRSGKALNITNREVQLAITAHCVNAGVKVLILDNLSTLASGMRENEADSWELVNNWLLDLRRRKIAVIIIHHAGRSGEMRGTSKREDNVSWIIALDDCKKDADDRRGARFVSRFTKPSRNTQEEVPAFEWHLVTDVATGLVSIGHKQAHSLDVFRNVIEAGVTKPVEIAKEMKIHDYQVSRLAKKAIDAGWLTKAARGEFKLVGAQK